MKQVILFVLILSLVQTSYPQKIVLYRSTGGDQVFDLSSIDSIKFLPFICGDNITYAGKTYHSVLIGDQCWLKENIDVGTRIDGSQNMSDNNTLEKYCYGDEPNNCTTYGGLYQWDEAMQYLTTEGAQGICPSSWHIPTLAEVQTLSTTVEGDGNALKEIGQGYGNGAGTNTSGFSAVLAGLRGPDGVFIHLGNYTVFWNSTELGVAEVYGLGLVSSVSNIYQYYYPTINGYSVRCLKD